MNTPKRPAINRINTVIDCGDAQIMAQFDDRWRVMLDPAGHPFCIDTDGEEP